jgi:hypothetical protein
MGGGRNGKRERETVTADLFGLERAPPRILERKRAAGRPDELQTLEGKI